MPSTYSVKKAIILSAGLASRMMPATKAISKPMLPIIDKPTIQYIVEELVESGINEIVIVVNKGDEQVKNHFSENKKLNSIVSEAGKDTLLEIFKKIEKMAKFHFVEQEKPLGPGHALLQCKKVIGKEPFILAYGDDLILGKKPASMQLIEAFQENKCHVVAVAEVPEKEVVHFGVIKPKANSGGKILQVEKIVEKPKLEDAPSNLAVVGRYLLLPEIFEILEKIPHSMKKELYVTPELQGFADNGTLFACVLEGNWFTTGKKEDFVKTIIAFSLEREDIKDEIKGFIKKLEAENKI